MSTAILKPLKDKRCAVNFTNYRGDIVVIEKITVPTIIQGQENADHCSDNKTTIYILSSLSGCLFISLVAFIIGIRIKYLYVVNINADRKSVV